jgi:type IV pilus assembly protein PilC
MEKFTYKAKGPGGQIVKGQVEAANAQAAAKLVRSKGFVVLSIQSATANPLYLIKNLRKRIRKRDVTTFTRQLATMINAGLPITEGLSILRVQTKSTFQPVITRILADVEGGESLSMAMGRYPQVFSPTYIALIKSGEAGGVLDKVLARLADNLEKEQEFRGRVKGALIYPAIIVVGMLLVGLIMMIFVIPRLTTLYTEFEAELPLPTKILIGISTLIIRFWPIVLFLVIAGFLGFRAYRKTTPGRRKTDELIFKIPIIGDLQRQVVLTELTRTLALMVGAGVSILESLAITAGVVGNVIISDALKDAAKQIEKGFPIAFSFAKHPEAFPYILSQMIAVGEETGKMEEVLFKVSNVFETESDEKVKTLTAAVEPLVMVILGLGVGFLVIAIILPIYNLTSQF